MNKTQYHAYLRSPEWQALRLRVLKRDGYKCAHCGASKPLDVHHKTYERVGRERMRDLVALCRECHEAEHEVEPEFWILRLVKKILRR